MASAASAVSVPESTFCLADISEGDPYTFIKEGVVSCGCIGSVEPHNGSSTHVVFNTMGEEVCYVRKNSPKVVRDNTVIVQVSPCATLAFEPAYPLFS